MADVDPKVLLKSIIESHGVSSEPRPYASLKGFFATVTEANVAAYDMETVGAIRKGILDDVQKLHETGKNLVACNKFGESIIHLACRHGKTDIVEFLMFQAGTSPRVVCDVSSLTIHLITSNDTLTSSSIVHTSLDARQCTMPVGPIHPISDAFDWSSKRSRIFSSLPTKEVILLWLTCLETPGANGASFSKRTVISWHRSIFVRH
jgi:hypothetical protein